MAANNPNEIRLTPEDAVRIRQRANEILSRETAKDATETILEAFADVRRENKELRDIVKGLLLMIPAQAPANLANAIGAARQAIRASRRHLSV
jgi:hypothetical protein